MSQDDRLKGLRELASTPRDNLRNVVALMFLLPIYEFFRSSADAIQAIMNIFIQPINAFAAGLEGLVDALLGGPVGILDTGATVSQQSLQEGVWAQFGPFTFTVAVVVVLSALYILAQYREHPETSDFLPGSSTDIPLIGSDEGDDS